MKEQIEELDIESRRAEKETQREADTRAVALGLKTAEQLRLENASFALAIASLASGFDLDAMRRPISPLWPIGDE